MLDLFGPFEIALIFLLALITSAIHGATGLAGGFLLTAALAPIIGVAPILPVISIALLFSHASRAVLNRADFNVAAFWRVALAATPCIIATAWLYGRMSSTAIAVVLGCVILSTIPLRHGLAQRSIKAGSKTLAAAGAVYGSLSGVAIGPGLLLAPFLLGFGLGREAFVATIAVIALWTNITRLSVYGVTDLLNSDLLVLGLLIGLVTIPGNWIGRAFLRRMTDQRHATYIDILAFLGAMNFFYLAFG